MRSSGGVGPPGAGRAARGGGGGGGGPAGGGRRAGGGEGRGGRCTSDGSNHRDASTRPPGRDSGRGSGRGPGRGSPGVSVAAEQIKQLREQTGAGIKDCRDALEKSGGDVEKAVELLRAQGLAASSKRADRETRNGILELYRHGEGRVGVVVEVNCETDFVGRTKEFRDFAPEVALRG